MEKPTGTETSTGHGTAEKGDGAGGPIILFFIAGLAASLIIGWVAFPKLLYSQKRQPIDFNHALHVELVDHGCQTCHYFRADGSFSGIPRLAECAECHMQPNSDDPEEVKFVEEYLRPGREVPWLVYSRQPDCVFFSHAAHVVKGRMECVTCHGPHGESTSLRLYEQNRISGYSRDIWGENISGIPSHPWEGMKMDRCVRCHAQHGRRDGCIDCHK
jgi:hypothetical protein